MTKKNKGFTLLELSVVIMVVGIITVGFMQSNALLLRKQKSSNTKKKMEIIQQALKNYILEQHNLPCPSGLRLIEGNANLGRDVTNCVASPGDGVFVYNDGTNDFIYGALPTVDLGLDSENIKDEWGNKFSYIVDKRFTTNFANQSSVASAIVVTTQGTSNQITDRAVYAIISHGENGHGAYGYLSGVKAEDGSSAEEAENIFESGAFDAKIVYDNYAEDFDDIVRYKNKAKIVMELKWEDVGCYIDQTLANAKVAEAGETANCTFSVSTYDHWDFYHEEEKDYAGDNNKCCILKCFQYGRIGFFVNNESCD